MEENKKACNTFGGSLFHGKSLYGKKEIGIIFLTILIYVSSICIWASAGFAEDPKLGGSILFFVRDSKTYFGIPGTTIEVYENDEFIATLITDDTGRARFESSKEERYDFKFTKDGYRHVNTEYTVIYGKEVDVDIMMTPLVPPKELRADYLKTLQKEAEQRREAVILGFIVDRETGSPLDGVRISAVNAGVSGISNKRGFFVIRIPSPPPLGDPETLPPLETLVFEKEGYI